MKLNKT